MSGGGHTWRSPRDWREPDTRKVSSLKNDASYAIVVIAPDADIASCPTWSLGKAKSVLGTLSATVLEASLAAAVARIGLRPTLT